MDVLDLNEADRHLLGLALIAFCCEYEGEANALQRFAEVRMLAQKLGVLSDLLDAMTGGAHDAAS